jgi:hypothetical protein
VTNTLYRENLSPELNILIRSTGMNSGDILPDFVNANRNIDWAFLIQLGIDHGVLPLLYNRLKNIESVGIHSSDIKKIKPLYLINAGRNTIVANRILKLEQLLSKHQIEVVFFKGAVLALQAFADLNLRNFCDIDVLIKPDDFERVYDILESEGYQSLKPAIGKRKEIWIRNRRNFEFKNGTFIYDFHQQVMQGPKFLQLKDCFNNNTAVEILSGSIPTLNAEDTVIMLVLHGTHHGWIYLKYVVDLAHFSNAHRNRIQWKNLMEKARHMGCRRMVLIGMWLCREYCNLELNSEVKRLLQQDKKSLKLVGYFSAQILSESKPGLIPVLAFPRSLDSWHHKIKYFLYFIFHPSDLDLLTVRFPVFLYPLYYIVRPLRLAINLIKKVFNRIVRENGKSM